MKNEFYIISHTHWDREWYQSQEEMRMRLVDLMDNLLEILEEYPLYVFHLDAQTVVLDDYVQIKPYNKDTLKKHIQNGNILVGPWYVQNDFYLSSGESTIRNLIVGTAIAKEFGKCEYTGYCPDQFGIIGQLPQIFKGFEIRHFIFGRGYAPFKEENGKYIAEDTQAEFCWRGTDNTGVLAINMKFWYNNAQRFSADIDKACKYLNQIKKSFERCATTPYLLLMNGVDHLEAQEDLLPIIEEMQKRLPQYKIKQSTLSEYANITQKYIEDKNIKLDEVKGELRKGTDDQLLQGTLSSRVYLKQKNRQLENNVVDYIEPIYTMIMASAGFETYPKDYISYIWKSLIPNHAHDSICGCSCDKVHRQMEDRFERIETVQNSLLERGLSFLTRRGTQYVTNKNEYIVCAVNPTILGGTHIADAKFYFLEKDKVTGFDIFAADGKKVDYVVKSKRFWRMDVIDPINLPGSLELDLFEVSLKLENLNAYSVSYFKLVPKTECENKLPSKHEGNFIQNSFYKINVTDEGIIQLKNYSNNKTTDNFLYFEDTADAGDSYVFRTLPQKDMPIVSCGKLAESFVIEDDFSKKLVLKFVMELPFDTVDFKRRSEKTISHCITLELEINNINPQIKCNYQFENKSKAHRLRMVIDTGINSKKTFSSSAFEMVEREIEEDNAFKGPDQPNYGVISIGELNDNCHIYNNGLHEYEHLKSSPSKIALTLLRATGYIYTEKGKGFTNGDIWISPDNNCLRELNGTVVVEFLEKEYIQNQTADKLKSIFSPVLVGFDSVDYTKYRGGRPCVQDSDLSEIFYRKDKYNNVLVPNNESFLFVDNNTIAISCVKKAEQRNAVILRLYNLSSEPQTALVSTYMKVSNAYISKLNEEIIEEASLNNLHFKPYEILTLTLNLQPN